MDRREAFARIVRRWPWYRRIRWHAYGLWLTLVDWVKDRWYGAPWETKR